MAFKARDVLIKAELVADSDTFTAVAGLQEASFSVSCSWVQADVIDEDQPQPVPGSASVSGSLSGSGLASDAESFDFLRTCFEDGTPFNAQFIYSESKAIRARVYITEFSRNGATSGAESFSASFAIELSEDSIGSALTLTTTTIDIDAGGTLVDDGSKDFNFTVSGLSGLIADVDIQLAISHTWLSDLTVRLIHPDTTFINLVSSRGGSGDHFRETYLDDSAAASISSAGSPPFAGPAAGGVSYRPAESALSAFAGKSPNGTWKLRIFDSFEGDSGSLFKAGATAPWGTADGTKLILTTEG